MGSDMFVISPEDPPVASCDPPVTDTALLGLPGFVPPPPPLLLLLFTSIMRTGAKQMARLWGFILFREDWALTRDKWSMMWTRQF